MPPDNVTLQEHLEALVEALRVQICTWEKAHSEKHLSEAKEVARRLDILNGEADRLRQMQMTYLPREVYELQYAKVVQELDRLRMLESNMRGQIIAYSAVVGLAIGIAAFVLNKLL
jgi:hypothetical protein